MDDIRGQLEKNLEILSERQRNTKKLLSQMPEGRLNCEIRNGEPYYLHVTGAKEECKRMGIGKRPDLINLLAQKKFLELSCRRLETNMRQLASCLSRWMDWDARSIMEDLPSTYRFIPGEVFDINPWMRTGNGSTAWQTTDETIRQAIKTAGEKTDPTERMKMIRQVQARWAAMPYKRNDGHPEGKTILTSQGLRVRSKSEALIAEKLYAHEIPFRYEPEIVIGTYRRAPDFAFLDWLGEEHFWEHSGMIHAGNYRKRRRWKLDLYESAGIVPWRNFIETFDDPDGNLDMEIVENEITGKLMKRLYMV